MIGVNDSVYAQSVIDAVYSYNTQYGDYYSFITAKSVIMILCIILIAFILSQFKFLGK